MHFELRNICFVRHAKSSWDDISLADFDRPLSNRGERDAPFMASKMIELHNIPDLVVTSPALRARTTARIFADAADLTSDAFITDERLYEASVQDIIRVVQDQEDRFQSIFVVGHNPGMTVLANSFAGVDIDNVPTCGVVQAKSMVKSWSDWTPETSAFVGFYYPKQYIL